jgi:hypothetical protein
MVSWWMLRRGKCQLALLRFEFIVMMGHHAQPTCIGMAMSAALPVLAC